MAVTLYCKIRDCIYNDGEGNCDGLGHVTLEEDTHSWNFICDCMHISQEVCSCPTDASVNMETMLCQRCGLLRK